MGNDAVRALLTRAAGLYQEGEILAALDEWEHALALDPDCQPAQRAIRGLRANYDLLDESLLPGGQALAVSEYTYPDHGDTGTRARRGGGVVIAAALEDTQPSEFHSEATAELPGIEALQAAAAAHTTAETLTAADEFDNLPTADLPGVAALSAMNPRGRASTAKTFATNATAELPGIASRAALPAGNRAPAQQRRHTDELARDFGTDTTLEHKEAQFDDIELGRSGAVPRTVIPAKSRALEDLGTRPTEELGGIFSGQGRDFAVEMARQTRQRPASSTGRGGNRAPNAADARPEDARPENARPDERAVPDTWPDGVNDTLTGDDDNLTGDTFADEDVAWAENTLTPASVRAIERTTLDAIERDVPAQESASDRTRRRIKALLELAKRAFARGDKIRAVIAAELAFIEDPDSAVSHKLLNLHRDTVGAIFESYLDDFNAAPALNVALTELKYEQLDARAAFLLSRVDGSLSLDELLDVAGMPRVEALRYLSSMVLRGILILAR